MGNEINILQRDLGQHRIIRGARLVRIYFRHLAQFFLESRKDSCEKTVQADEKTAITIRTPELCGIALI